MGNHSVKIHGNVDMRGDVYYKLIVGYESGLVTVACLQDFDEGDYGQERFIRNSNDEIHVFEYEEDAIIKLNEWFKQEEIDPQYRRKNIGGIELIKD